MDKVNELILRGLARLQVKAWEAEEGQTFAEYGLILAIVAVGLIAATVALRNRIGQVFSSIVSGMSS